MQISTVLLIGLGVFISGVMASNYMLAIMIGEINKQRLEGTQISYFGFTFPKIVDIVRHYRRQHPKGRYHIAFLATLSLGLLGLLFLAKFLIFS